MAKRVYPTKTERSREILGAALTTYQEANTSADLETSLKAVRKETTGRFQNELDMTPECANTYFQNRKRELVSALASVSTNGADASAEVQVAASEIKPNSGDFGYGG